MSDSNEVLSYQQRSKGVLAVKWDGTQASAGMIIEWVQSTGESARYFETNETPWRMAPEIRIQQDASSETLIKDFWLIYHPDELGRFIVVNDEEFQRDYERQQ